MGYGSLLVVRFFIEEVAAQMACDVLATGLCPANCIPHTRGYETLVSVEEPCCSAAVNLYSRGRYGDSEDKKLCVSIKNMLRTT